MSRGLDRDDEGRDYSTEPVRQARQAVQGISSWERERDARQKSAEPGETAIEIHRLPSRASPVRREPDRGASFEPRRGVRHREREYRLRDSEIVALTEIGRFRTVNTADLRDYRYAGDGRRMSADLQSLLEQGLAETHRIRTSDGGRLDVVVLSKEGRNLAERFDEKSGQRHYSGLAKPREAAHDAAIYRIFQAEEERIRADGGEVTKVILDHELKSRVFGVLEKRRQEGLEAEDLERVQAQVAQANGLQVIDRKIPLPDLQIESRTADGGLSRVNLELTTENYKSAQIAAKVSAGFKLYALGGSSEGGGAVRDEREVTADILSL